MVVRSSISPAIYMEALNTIYQQLGDDLSVPELTPSLTNPMLDESEPLESDNYLVEGFNMPYIKNIEILDTGTA